MRVWNGKNERWNLTFWISHDSINQHLKQFLARRINILGCEDYENTSARVDSVLCRKKSLLLSMGVWHRYDQRYHCLNGWFALDSNWLLIKELFRKLSLVFHYSILSLQGDPSVPTSLKPFVQPTSTLSVDVTKNTPIRPSEIRTTFEVPKTAFSSVTSQSLQQKERSSLSNTFATPASSTPAYLPKHSLSPGISPSGMKTVPQKSTDEFWGALPTSQAPPLDWPFVSSTATELGLVDRPDTSYEGLQLSSIVDRITDSFPLAVNSGTKSRCSFIATLICGLSGWIYFKDFTRKNTAA